MEGYVMTTTKNITPLLAIESLERALEKLNVMEAAWGEFLAAIDQGYREKALLAAVDMAPTSARFDVQRALEALEE